MADEDLVCGQCGTPAASPVNNTVSPAPAADFTNSTPLNTAVTRTPDSKNTKVGKIIVFSAIGVVALLLLLLLVNLLGGGSGYKGTVDKYVKALKNEDADLLVSISSPILLELGIGDEDDLLDEMEYYIDYNISKIEKDVGDIKKITYEIEDFDLYSDRKLKKEITSALEMYGIDSDVKQAAEATVNLHVKGSDDDADYTARLLMTKHRKGWRILSQYDLSLND